MPVNFYFPLFNYKMDLVPGEVSLTAMVTARHIAMSSFPTHSSANVSQPWPWNTLCHSKPSVKTEKCADTEIPAVHRYAIFGDISEKSHLFCKRSARLQVLGELSGHCVVTCILMTQIQLSLIYLYYNLKRNLKFWFFLTPGEVKESQAFSVRLWMTAVIWESGLLSLVSSPQAHLQSQGPTGNICQCPLHNTELWVSWKNWTLQYMQRKFQNELTDRHVLEVS